MFCYGEWIQRRGKVERNMEEKTDKKLMCLFPNRFFWLYFNNCDCVFFLHLLAMIFSIYLSFGIVALEF